MKRFFDDRARRTDKSKCKRLLAQANLPGKEVNMGKENGCQATIERNTTSLYYREGTSDKEYHARVEPKGIGFVVNFAYGRRGSTMNTGTKTTSPVSYADALGIFDKLVLSKKAKGYTEGADGTPYQSSEKADRISGILPQLLNPIEEHEVAGLISDPSWGMQEKKNGRRMLLRKEGAVVEGINRKGLIVSLPETVAGSSEEIPGDFILDGECIGDTLHVFDLLVLNSEDLRPKPYYAHGRYMALLNLLNARGLTKHIRPLPCFIDALGKAKWLETFKEQKAEGVVFKRLDAPYTAGCPASGGDQLKYKFYATLSAVVDKVNAHRSVALRLLNHHDWIRVGNVTIPPSDSIPKVGAVVEVRYLYAYPNGCLFQPVYLGERTDIDPEDCLVSQLKLKRGEEEEEA